MPRSSSGNLGTLQPAVSFDKTLELIKRNTGQQLHCSCAREWSFSLEMEVNAKGSRSNEKQRLQCPIASNGGNKPSENEVNVTTSVFVNHAAMAWQETRSKWRGDQSQQSKTMTKDPIISWSTTYEDLLSNNEPFSEPIPLPEMVDFLVDIWHDEGLFD